MASDRSSASNALPLHSPDDSPVVGRHIQQPTIGWEGDQSDDIFKAVESRDCVKLREIVSGCSEDLDKAILDPSTSVEHPMRTPLMAAANSGDLAIFTTISRAVDQSIRRHGEVSNATNLKKKQLQYSDEMGVTVLMLAVRSGHVGVLEAVMGRLQAVQDPERLLDKDHSGKTVLMFAAGAGGTAMLDIILNAIATSFPEMIEEQLLTKSGDGRTILMHATGCGDQMGVLSITHACRKFIMPAKMRQLLTAVDAEGITFLMHATSSIANINSGGSTSVTTGGPKSTRQHLQNQKRPNQQDALDEETGDGAGRDNASTPEEGEVPAGGAMDPRLAVQKAAWSVVKEVLWKQQIREQFRLTDSWGRSVFVHAVISGQPNIFDAVFVAAREYLLDDEIDELLGINDQDNVETAMEAAVDSASKSMASRVARRDLEIKKAIALNDRASTIESKMQEFIPGKLIVVFQLLLAEVGTSNGAAFFLLIAMSLTAPILAWGSSLLSRNRGSANSKRTSPVTLFLSAPALFFWGLGTSSIAQDSTLNWKPSASATALAVATTVIPSIDAFFASQRVGQWYEKEHVAWLKEQRKMTAAASLANSMDAMKAFSDEVPSLFSKATPLPRSDRGRSVEEKGAMSANAAEEEAKQREGGVDVRAPAAGVWSRFSG